MHACAACRLRPFPSISVVGTRPLLSSRSEPYIYNFSGLKLYVYHFKSVEIARRTCKVSGRCLPEWQFSILTVWCLVALASVNKVEEGRREKGRVEG